MVDNHKEKCNECKGTGDIDPVPHWFAEDGSIIAKWLQPDGSYIDCTEDDYINFHK